MNPPLTDLVLTTNKYEVEELERQVQIWANENSINIESFDYAGGLLTVKFN